MIMTEKGNLMDIPDRWLLPCTAHSTYLKNTYNIEVF